MQRNYGFGTIVLAILVLVGIVIYETNKPNNGPTGDIHGGRKYAPVSTAPGQGAFVVAASPHFENTPAVIGALAIPGLTVLTMLYKFATGPRKNAGMFLAIFLGCLFLGGWLSYSAFQLEHGESVGVIKPFIPLFETFGAWAPAYCFFGIAGLGVLLAAAGSLFPQRKQDLETI